MILDRRPAVRRALPLLVWMTIGLGPWGWAHDPLALDRAEDILKKSGSLARFLGNPDAVDAYYREMAAYFGKDRFAKKSYDAILAQLKPFLGKIPGLAERLWETTDLGESFTIRGVLQDRWAESFTPEKWNDFLKDWREKLAAVARRILEEKDPDASAKALAAEADREIRQFEAVQKAGKGSRKANAHERAAFYKSLRQSERMKELSSYYLLEELKRPPFSPSKGSTDPIAIRQALQAMAQGRSPSAVPAATPEKMRPFLRSFVAAAGFGESKTLSVRFRAVPRRFHGLFKGIRECAGGDIRSLESLMPERFLTIAARKSRLWFVEDEGFNGLVHAVPVVKKGKTYASLDLLSESLNQFVFVERFGKGFDAAPRTVFDEAYARLYEQKPSEWIGFAVGNTRAVDNAKAQNALMASKAYAYGEDLGDPQALRTEDAIESLIVKNIPLSKPTPVIERYRNSRLVFDVAVRFATRATSLAPPEAFQEAPSEEKIADEKWIRSMFGDFEKESRIFAVFANRKPRNPQVSKALEEEARFIREALTSPRHRRRRAAERLLEFARPDSVQGILKFSKLRLSPGDSVEEAREDLLYLGHLGLSVLEQVRAGVSRFLSENWDERALDAWLQKDPSFLAQWPKYPFLPRSAHQRFFKRWAAQAAEKCGRTAGCYLDAFWELWSEGGMWTHRNFVDFLLDGFYRDFYKPMLSEDSWAEDALRMSGFLAAYEASEESQFEIRFDGLGFARSADQYLALAQPLGARAGEGALRKRDERILSTFKDSFLKWGPDIGQIHDLVRSAHSVETAMAILEEAFARVKKAGDAVRLFDVFQLSPGRNEAFRREIDAFLVARANDFFALKPSFVETQLFQRSFYFPESVIKYATHALEAAPDAESYLSMAASFGSSLMKATFEKGFLPKKPTMSQIVSFIVLSRHPAADRAVIRSFIHGAASKEEIVDVLGKVLTLESLGALESGEPAGYPELDDLAIEGFEAYLKWEPSVEEIRAFRVRTTNDARIRDRMTEIALEKARTPMDFIALSQVTYDELVWQPAERVLASRSRAVVSQLKRFLDLAPKRKEVRMLEKTHPAAKADLSSAVKERRKAEWRASSGCSFLFKVRGLQ